MALTDRMLDLMDRLEVEFAPQIAAALQADMLAMTEQFRQTRLPAAGQAGQRELETLLRLMWGQAVQLGAEAFTQEFAEGFPAAHKSDLLSGLVEQFVSGLRPGAASQILSTSQTQVRDLMAGGLASGESADAVYLALLERIPEISRVRGLLISRTEIHAATQFAAWQLARRSTVPLVKVWNSVNDERTRDFGELGRISQFNHRAMNGIRVGLNEFFLVPRIIGGYETLMFPGDPRGSASNVINCRCVQSYERA